MLPIPPEVGRFLTFSLFPPEESMLLFIFKKYIFNA
jgi:hypothetical protein